MYMYMYCCRVSGTCTSNTEYMIYKFILVMQDDFFLGGGGLTSFVSFVVYTTTRQSAVLSITWTSHVMPVHTLYKLLEDRTVSKYWPTITGTLVEGVPGARVGTFRILLAALVFFVPLSHWTTVSHGFLQIALPVWPAVSGIHWVRKELFMIALIWKNHIKRTVIYLLYIGSQKKVFNTHKSFFFVIHQWNLVFVSC